MKVSAHKSAISTGLLFTLTNGLGVSMLDKEHPDGTREFAILDQEGELLRLGDDTIAFATRDQILALIEVMEARPLVEARQAARAVVAFLETLAAPE